MRNIKWYLKSMSPDEFPLKPGQWKSVQKKTPKAVEEAAKLHPRLPGEKVRRAAEGYWT
jgi:hypothetical protein